MCLFLNKNASPLTKSLFISKTEKQGDESFLLLFFPYIGIQFKGFKGFVLNLGTLIVDCLVFLFSRSECYRLDSFFGQEDNSVGQIFYREVSPLISELFHGRNATVFAYGATGSGKTFTMQV